MPDLASRIKKVRDMSQLSQAEFAGRLGVDRAHISRIENGRANPSEALLRLICEVYGVRLPWLIEGEVPVRTLNKIKTDEQIHKFQVLKQFLELYMNTFAALDKFVDEALNDLEGADPKLCPHEVLRVLKTYIVDRDSKLSRLKQRLDEWESVQAQEDG